MLCVAFLFLVAFFAIPNPFSSTTTKVSDYEAFYNSFMDMISTYDAEGKVVASSAGDDDLYSTRLIVDTNKTLDERNAVASCHYDGTHILQYEDCETAEKAYQFYTNSGFKVQYDVKVTADTVSSSSVTYNSWGWDAKYDFMGVNSYLTTLEATTDSSEYSNVVVAVLDSGINSSHTLFSGRILSSLGRNFTNEGSGRDDFEDRNGHGTHVSGTIAEVTPSSVHILPLKVLDQNGEGYSSYIINAIIYATELRNGTNEKKLPSGYDLRLMNMSLGVSSGYNAEVRATATGIETQINNAYSAGILSVVAAGNERQDTKHVQPANVANAITVTALKRYSTFSKMYILFDDSYSNYGDTVDFGAPGSYINSAWIDSNTATNHQESGTSMATPHVTACVALLYMNPTYKNKTPAQMYEILQDNAKKSDLYPSGTYAMGSRSWNKYYGYGCVNIADCAVKTTGKVTFDVSNQFQSSAFTLGLGYSENYSGYTLQIKYSLNDGSYQTYNSSTKLNLTASAKISAVAYVYSGTTIIKASEITTKTYYINNYDVESAYTIDSSGAIKYSGTELTTLNVPNMIGTREVKYISKNAFSSSPVKVINLPNTIRAIYEEAFAKNANLTTVNCSANVSGNGVEIGRLAFQKCTSLANFNIPHVKSLGESALAYTVVTKVTLSDVTTIGKNAFSASSLKTLVVGKNVTAIESHADPFNLEKVYGYAGTKAEEFANTYNATFYDLTLSISKDFGTKKVVKRDDFLSISLEINGYELSSSNCVEETGIASSKYSKTLTNVNDNHYTLTYNFSNLPEGEYNFKVTITDGYGESVASSKTKIYVVADSVEGYDIAASAGNYDVYVDNYLINPSTFKVYSGYSYDIKIVAEAGYKADDINIAGFDVEENETKTITPTEDVVITINSAEMNVLRVTFNIENGHVEIGGHTLSQVDVDRNANCVFTIVGETGYYAKRVLVNGEVLESETNTFTIENVATNKTVDILMESAYYEIDVTYVNSCGVLHAGNLKKVAYGTAQEITVVANDGYKVDFVTVNGIVVKVTNGTFKVENVTKDTDVVVSFAEKGKSIFSSDNAIILDYFIVFVAIFAVFIVARVALFIVRKKRQ